MMCDVQAAHGVGGLLEQAQSYCTCKNRRQTEREWTVQMYEFKKHDLMLQTPSQFTSLAQ